MPAGHVFIVRGDPDRLACDLRMSENQLRPHGDGGDSADDYLDSVRRGLAETGDRVRAGKRATDRALPLVAVPVLGVAECEGRDCAGEVLAGTLPLLQGAARDGRFDVAWVAGDGPTFAAAQAARRRQSDGDPWPDLDDELRRQ